MVLDDDLDPWLIVPYSKTMATKKTKEPSFEQILARLESISKELEKGETTLEQSVQLYEEGVKLAKQGRVQLEHAEHKLEQLREDATVEPLHMGGEKQEDD